MTAQLHCFGESGNAYKAALALRLCGIDWEPVHVDFFAGEARSAEWRARVNPMGEVPVLIDRTRDLHLTQSGVIQDWAAEQSGAYRWRTDVERREVLRWTLFDNHKLSGQNGPLRFLMNFLPPEKRPQEVIGYLTGRLRAAYGVLDAHLSDRDWVAADRPTIADLSCCGYLFYPEPFGFDRADWPAIDRWLDRISALPGWAHPYDLMTRAYPPAST